MTKVGFLRRRGKSGFEALDLEDRSLGMFRTRAEAIKATIDARKRPRSTPTLTEITDPETIAAIRRDDAQAKTDDDASN
jgi:hypothetical protein